MSRYFIIVFVVFLLSGCGTKEPQANMIGEKSFDNEDFIILSALEAQKNGNVLTAIELYKILYENSKKVNYLIEAVKLSFLSNNTIEIKALLNEALRVRPNNNELKRIEIGYLIKQKKIKEAEKKVLILLENDKSVRNLKIAGTIYFQMKSYKLSLKYFESAYKDEHDENSLLNIVDIQYNYLNKKDDAIALLETHIRMQMCEKNSCFKLIEIYGKEKNINGIISTYKKLYKRFKDEEFAKKIVELLVYLKDKKGAIEFLEESGYNQEMLLDIYVSSKDFKNAFEIAQRLYKKTNSITYLGKMAIYEYEYQKDKLDKKILESVAKKFEKVVDNIYDPLYLNYYGYLLIDHDMDIKKGINLVKAALLKEPNSLFYLDSLAWGLYKQNKCEEAKKIMIELVKKSKEKELIEHLKQIEECIKGKNK